MGDTIDKNNESERRIPFNDTYNGKTLDDAAAEAGGYVDWYPGKKTILEHDLFKMRKYAQEKGVSREDLTEEEKEMFKFDTPRIYPRDVPLVWYNGMKMYQDDALEMYGKYDKLVEIDAEAEEDYKRVTLERKKNEVLAEQDDLLFVFCYALRYALGRETFASLTITDFLIENIKLFNERWLVNFLRDITTYEIDRKNGLINDAKFDFQIGRAHV